MTASEQIYEALIALAGVIPRDAERIRIMNRMQEYRMRSLAERDERVRVLDCGLSMFQFVFRLRLQIF